MLLLLLLTLMPGFISSAALGGYSLTVTPDSGLGSPTRTIAGIVLTKLEFKFTLGSALAANGKILITPKVSGAGVTAKPWNAAPTAVLALTDCTAAAPDRNVADNTLTFTLSGAACTAASAARDVTITLTGGSLTAGVAGEVFTFTVSTSNGDTALTDQPGYTVVAAPQWTINNVVVDRAYGGTSPIRMIIDATSVSPGSTIDDFLIVTSSRPIFAATVPLADVILAVPAGSTATGYAGTAKANPLVSTGASGSQEMKISAANAATTAGRLTITLQGGAFVATGQPAAGTVVAVNVKSTTSTAVIINDVAATSGTFTMAATGRMSAVSAAITYASPPTSNVPTGYLLSFTPGVDVTIPVITTGTTTSTNLVVTATGSANVLVANTAANAPTAIGMCKFSSLAVVNSGASTTLTIVVKADTDTCTFKAGTSYTIDLSKQVVGTTPTVDSTIVLNAKFTDTSGNVFNAEAATGYTYTVPGSVTISLVTLTRSIPETNPVTMAITFTSAVKVMPTDVITVTSPVNSFVSGSSNPSFVAMGCTLTFKSATGATEISWTVSGCASIAASAAATLNIPQAYLAVNPANAGSGMMAMQINKADGSLRAYKVDPAAANYALSPAAAMTATTTTVTRLVAGAHPLGMTVSFTPAMPILDGDTVTFICDKVAFVKSLPSPPTFTVGSCTFTLSGLSTDGKQLNFLLSGGTPCTLAAKTSFVASIPAVFLEENPAAGAVKVTVTTSYKSIAVNNEFATAVTYTTAATTASATTVINATAVPVLFPNAPVTGLSLRFKLGLPIGHTDIITITSSVAIFKTTPPAPSTVTIGNCLLTLKTGSDSKILKFTLSTLATAPCFYDANADIDLAISPSSSDPTLPSSAATFLENNPTPGTVVKVVVSVEGGAAGVTVAPAQAVTAVTGYIIVGTLPPTGPGIDLLGVQNQSNLTSWVAGIVTSHVQEDNSTQGRIVWTKCARPLNLRLTHPNFAGLNVLIKACAPGVDVVRTLCFIQSFNLNSLGVTINTQYPPLFGCNVDKFGADGVRLPDVSLQLEVQYILPINYVFLYRTSQPAGIRASDIGGKIQVLPLGTLKSSVLDIPRTSLVTGSTTTTATTTTNATNPSTSTTPSGSSDDSAVAIGVGIGVGVGVPVLLLLLGLCWYFLFGPGAQAAAEPVNEVFYVADDKYGPQGNAYGYYGYPPGMA